MDTKVIGDSHDLKVFVANTKDFNRVKYYFLNCHECDKYLVL